MKLCICSSFKFYRKVLVVAEHLNKNGIETLVPVPNKYFYAAQLDEKLSQDQNVLREFWIHITNHLKRIDEADVVYIWSENGYVGKGVGLEIGYAYSKGKRIYSSEKITDLPIASLISEVVLPGELIERLGKKT